MCLTFKLEINVVYVSQFPGVISVKNPPAGDKRHKFIPWVGKIPWSRKWQSTSVFLLENPMDRRAWQATVHEITKSGTWLSLHCTAAALQYYFELDCMFASTSEFYTFFQLKNSFSLSYKACLVMINSFALFVWKYLYLCFKYERQHNWIKYSWLKFFLSLF